MIQTRDKEINEILDRAEKYRKQFKEKESYKNISSFDDYADFGEIFRAFFNHNNEFNCDDDKNNVFIKCKLTKENLKNGCKKIIKYKLTDKNNKIISKKIEVKFPKNINVGQKVIVSGCGNYIKEDNTYGNLVIVVVCKSKKYK